MRSVGVGVLLAGASLLPIGAVRKADPVPPEGARELADLYNQGLRARYLMAARKPAPAPQPAEASESPDPAEP